MRRTENRAAVERIIAKGTEKWCRGSRSFRDWKLTRTNIGTGGYWSAEKQTPDHVAAAIRQDGKVDRTGKVHAFNQKGIHRAIAAKEKQWEEEKKRREEAAKLAIQQLELWPPVEHWTGTAHACGFCKIDEHENCIGEVICPCPPPKNPNPDPRAITPCGCEECARQANEAENETADFDDEDESV